MNFPDEMLDHFLGDLEIGDDPVAHWANGLDIARRAAEHQLGIVAHGANGFLAAARRDGGDHRRLVEHDAATLDDT